tara:strand:+ start:4312 stop:4968 length:657 start_codon:yes stop_codon:yes gene_type:complete
MLEIATFSLEDAFRAAEAGADRIEVCKDYKTGGITPPTEWIFALNQAIQTPIVSMVRTRGGEFHYSNQEIQEIRNQGHSLKSAGTQEFILGCLNQKSEIDVSLNKSLIQDWGLPAALHRAFDECQDSFQAIDDAIESGFVRILTAKGTENIELLEEMKKYANGRIEIIPGGGIRSENIEEYIKIGFNTIHSSAKTGIRGKMDPGEIALLKLKLNKSRK